MKGLIPVCLAVVTAATLTACSDSDEQISWCDKGLQYISVDGTAIDLTEGTEAVETALGERFAVLYEDSLNENVMLTAFVFDSDHITYGSKAEYAEPTEHIKLFKGMPSNMTADEFCNAYEGLYYDSYSVENNKKVPVYEMVQVNDRVITVAELNELQSGTLRDRFGNGTADDVVVIFQCRFDEQKCISYSLEVSKGPYPETEY